jgi:hypothetical protein
MHKSTRFNAGSTPACPSDTRARRVGTGFNLLVNRFFREAAVAVSGDAGPCGVVRAFEWFKRWCIDLS